MRMKAKLFSIAREKTALSDVEFPFIPGMTLIDLENALTDHCPGFQGLVGRWAVNLDFVAPTYEIRPGDEIASIPPVSGG